MRVRKRRREMRHNSKREKEKERERESKKKHAEKESDRTINERDGKREKRCSKRERQLQPNHHHIIIKHALYLIVAFATQICFDSLANVGRGRCTRVKINAVNVLPATRRGRREREDERGGWREREREYECQVGEVAVAVIRAAIYSPKK
jgi:hypothetical protein